MWKERLKGWEESHLSSHKITNSSMWKEFDWKVKVRYFRTPSSGVQVCWRVPTILLERLWNDW